MHDIQNEENESLVSHVVMHVYNRIMIDVDQPEQHFPDEINSTELFFSFSYE